MKFKDIIRQGTLDGCRKIPIHMRLEWLSEQMALVAAEMRGVARSPNSLSAELDAHAEELHDASCIARRWANDINPAINGPNDTDQQRRAPGSNQ